MAGFYPTYGSYQPYYPSYIQPMPQMQNNAQPAMTQSAQPYEQGAQIWVMNEEAAKAYPVAAGKSVLMFDTEKPYFYIKTVKENGMPMPLEKYTFSEVKDNAEQTVKPEQQIDLSEYVTRDEFEKAIEGLKPKKKTITKDGEADA